MQRVKSYESPASISEVIELLAERPGVKLLAGGTDLIIALNEWAISPPGIIDLKRVPELKEIHDDISGLRIGSMVTFSEISENVCIRSKWTALSEAASVVAAPQIRNRATIGGNVANGAVAADSVPALMALGATAELVSVRGIRHVPVSELMLDLNATAIGPDELLTCFRLPNLGAVSAFEKIGRRKAQAISRICLATALNMDGDRVEKAHIAVGAAGRRAYLCPEVSELLVGHTLDEERIKAASDKMEQHVAQVLGERPTAPYKKRIAAASLESALLRLQGGQQSC